MKKRFGQIVSHFTSQEGLGIYVHFPWCLKKCPYCDFLSVAVKKGKDGSPPNAAEARRGLPHDEYADAIIAEWRSRIGTLTQPAPLLRSIFFGGGTPSLWKAESLGRVLSTLLDEYPGPIAPDLEISVECNPTSLSRAHAESLEKLGINRLSVGVQNLDPKRLEFLGRLHDPGGGLRAVHDALSSGVPRVSADLIYGIYSQSPEDARADVGKVANTGVTHMSAYSLTIEENTRFGALNAQGKLPLLDDEIAAHSFNQVSSALEDRGLRHYEISNFSRPGHESIHNLGYWLGRDYLGLGTGAFGTVTTKTARFRYRNLLSPERSMALWNAHSPPELFLGPKALAQKTLSECEEITSDEAHQESFLLGLRTIFGVSLEEMADNHGGDPLANGRRDVLQRLFDEGKLEKHESRLRIPKKHWLFADGIIRQLI